MAANSFDGKTPAMVCLAPWGADAPKIYRLFGFAGPSTTPPKIYCLNIQQFFFGNGRLSHSLTICSIPGANFISTAVLVVYHSTMCVLIYDGTSRYGPESWSMLLRLSCRDRLAVHWSAYRPSDARHCCSFTAVTLCTIISLPSGPVLAAAEMLCPEVHVTHVWHASLCTYHPHRLRDHFQLANAASLTLQSCTSNTR